MEYHDDFLAFFRNNGISPENLARFLLKLYHSTETDDVANSSKLILFTVDKLKQKITDILLKLGISARLAGFNYLVESICYYIQIDPTKKKINFEKDVKQRVAKNTGSSVSKISRDMDTAIKGAFNDNSQPFKELLGLSSDYAPYTTDFVARISIKLKNGLL